MLRRSVVPAALALIALAASLPAAAAGAASPIRLLASVDRGAQMGAPTALRLELRANPRLIPSPVTSARLLYPRGLGIVSSGLGLESCVRPASDFEQVIIPTTLGLAGCPRNSVMGYGSAIAEVKLRDGQIIPEYATATVLAGPIVQGKLGLVVFVDGQRPFGAKLALAGEVGEAPAPFGGALHLDVPTIPTLDGVAVVSLVKLGLTIGSRRIVYHERDRGRLVRYHPDGVLLPGRCPRRGLRFRARLTFENGRHATATTAIDCSRFAPAAR